MTKRLNVRNLLALAILLLAGTLIFMVVRNFKGGGPEEILETLSENVDLALKEINYTETHGGIPRWTLKADTAAHSVGDGITQIENIRLTFYGHDAAGKVSLTAQNGALKIDSREIEVSGNVVVESSRGYAFYTEQVQYREDDRLLQTEYPVRLVWKKMEITGRGMRLDVRNQTFALLSDVEAIIEETWSNKE